MTPSWGREPDHPWANRRGPEARPFPSLLLVIRAAGFAIADPRADAPVDVTIDDVEVLMELGAAASGGDTPLRDPPALDRLRALDLLVDADDPVEAPPIAASPLTAGGATGTGGAPVRVVTPSLIRLHEGRPLVWDRHRGRYQELDSGHLRIIAGLLGPSTDDTTSMSDEAMTALLSVGLVEVIGREDRP